MHGRGEEGGEGEWKGRGEEGEEGYRGGEEAFGIH